MWETIVVLVEFGLLGLAVGVWGAYYHAQNRVAVRRRVLVNLMSGSAIDGVLWARRGRFLLLRNAKLLEPGAQPVSMDGEILVDRDRVDFVQVSGGA